MAEYKQCPHGNCKDHGPDMITTNEFVPWPSLILKRTRSFTKCCGMRMERISEVFVCRKCGVKKVGQHFFKCSCCGKLIYTHIPC